MNWTRKLIDELRHLRIVPKLIFGYILLILIPFVLFGFFFYRQTYDHLLVQYRVDKEKLMEHSLSNLELDLSKIDSISPLFQNNDTMIEFISGQYEADWEMIYYYLKEIRPIFSFAYGSNPLIKKATIYKTNSAVLNLATDLMDISLYKEPVDLEEINALKPAKALWTFNTRNKGQLPSIYYTKKLYNDTYTHPLGFLQIQINDQLLQQFFETLPSEKLYWKSFVDAKGQLIYREDVPGWSEEQLTSLAQKAPRTGINSFYVDNNRYLVHLIQVPILNTTILVIGKVEPLLNLRSKQSLLIGAIILLLAILSLFYFAISSSLAKRLIRFSRHLKRVDHPKVAEYTGASGTDEIGFLINSYNAMIRRMDELTQDIHQTVLLKKEAEIKMLQAQIKPHFLYNTLETIRMMALMKNEVELAEMALSLGSLLRYSLVKNKDEATLAEELENVLNYIEIHRIRMGDRLTFQMQIDVELNQLSTPRFILQPIVENSILHGFSQIRGKCILSLHIFEVDEVVVIRIADNGGGIPEDRLQQLQAQLLEGSDSNAEKAGIGLVNVNERIKSYFGSHSGIRMESKDGAGAVFEIRLVMKGRIRDVKAADRR